MHKKNALLIICFLFFLLITSLRKPKQGRRSTRSSYRGRAPSNELRDDEIVPKVIIARILGNDLPPLHYEHQTYINMKFIIDNERLPDNFDRFWTVNCLETERKVQNLTGFLIARQERFNVLSCSNKTVAEKYVADILRANKARNFAIRSSFKLFKPHWVFLFDGSQFLTEEGLGTITKVLKTSIPLLHLTPAYRLIYKYAIDWKTKFEEIIDFICEAGDAQIGMNKVAYAILKKWEIFEEDLLYSMDKRQQIWALDTS